MSEEDKNPEEKPSFFDFSDEEASSWPPKDSVPLEEQLNEDGEIPLSAFTQDSPEPEPDAPASEPSAAAAEPEEFDVEDLFSDDFANESASSEPEPPIPDLEPVSETPLPDLVPTEPEAAPVEDLLPDFEAIEKTEPEPELELTSPKAEDDEGPISIDELMAEQEAQSSPQPVEESIEPATATEEEEGVMSVTEPLAEAIDDQFEQESVDALYNDYSEAPASDPVANIIDETEETLPFRTFTTYDYSEEGLSEADLNEEEEEKPGLNRNVLILVSVLLLIGGWYGFQAMFSRDYSSKRGRDRKSRRSKGKKIVLQEKEQIPIWELSNQNFSSISGETVLIKDMYYEAGRQNPFMLPDSVLADMVKAAELEMIKNQKPNTYRRKAFRATLIGVLTSTENTIALVDYQEAVFDILEDTTKEKILKLATKAMDKTKENTQEMIVGSYIGPWQITKIDAPEDPFIEPRITIEHNQQVKVLNMGKAMELGIFDDEGNFDNLEGPVNELALDEFKW